MAGRILTMCLHTHSLTFTQRTGNQSWTVSALRIYISSCCFWLHFYWTAVWWHLSLRGPCYHCSHLCARLCVWESDRWGQPSMKGIGDMAHSLLIRQPAEQLTGLVGPAFPTSHMLHILYSLPYFIPWFPHLSLLPAPQLGGGGTVRKIKLLSLNSI